MDKESAISWLQGVADRVQKCASDASMVIFPSSMKTIPFAVPPNQRPQSPRRPAAEGPISPRKGAVPMAPEGREDSPTSSLSNVTDPVSPATRDPWESLLLATTESRAQQQQQRRQQQQHCLWVIAVLTSSDQRAPLAKSPTSSNARSTGQSPASHVTLYDPPVGLGSG
ncbi:hypothetical protein LSH36_320g07024 [Paralvinella palmiformis]|uniref:Uncharacterized protein n=1 Tax=Paralvinella palmiformis TaxID=53620 RepID=A0AAD9JHC1_9ANNE|nr:hypothetical protein LSH36_320g07024 [Paralvinella palmiformis]